MPVEMAFLSNSSKGHESKFIFSYDTTPPLGIKIVIEVLTTNWKQNRELKYLDFSNV